MNEAEDNQKTAPDDKTPAEAFNDGIRQLQEQIVLRLRSLKRGLEREIDRCRETNNAPDLARAYARFRNVWSEEETSIQEEMKAVGKLFSRLAEVDFPEILERSGMHNVPIADADINRTMGVQVRTKASIKSGFKQEAIDYLRADRDAIDALETGDMGFAHHCLMLGHRKELAEAVKSKACSAQDAIKEIRETTDGLENIVVDHVFPQTLSSLAKDWAEEGKELPEEIFSTYLQPTTTWRKIASK